MSPTPQTPPTDRPLTAGDVPLLREGDVLRANSHFDGVSVRHLTKDSEYIFLSKGHRGWIKIPADDRRNATFWTPGNFTFVRRPATSEGEGVDAIDDLVDRFATALRDKLHAAEVKYGHDDAWMRDDWQEALIRDLNRHMEKGDPRDVAAYCAFAWHHGWPTALASPPVSERERELEAEVARLRDVLLGIAESDHYRRYPKQHEDGGIRGQSGLRAVRALTRKHGSYINDDEVRAIDAEQRRDLTAQPAGEGK